MANLGGVKKGKNKTTKDKMVELNTSIQNLQMAAQMSQMMVKHITNEVTLLKKDLGNAMGMLNDFQYRTLAMLELGPFTSEEVDAKAETFKLKDFNEASDKEDLDKGYLDDAAGVVGEDSLVLITSTTDVTPDRGIFRSKFPMSDCTTPELREKFIGAKVGDVFAADLDNVTHNITILGLRKLPPQVDIVDENLAVDEGKADDNSN